MKTIPLRDGELAELIGFSMSSGEAICGNLGGGLRLDQTGPKTLAKLAEMRGITKEALLS